MDRDEQSRDRGERGVSEQLKGEAWTQAKSKRAVPGARPEEFEEFVSDTDRSSTNTAEASDEPVTPEYAEPPSKAAGREESRD